MSKTIMFVVILALAVGGLGYVFKGLDSQVKRLKFENERAALKEKFAEKVPHIAVSDPEHATYDLIQGFKNYAKDLADLYRKYPEFKGQQPALERYEQEYKDKKIDESKMRLIRERVDLAKKVFTSLSKGDYKPVAMASDKTVRMDIYDIAKVSEGGEDKLFWHMLIINAPSDKATSFGPINMELPLEDDASTARARKAGRLADNKAIRKATVSGPGEPNTLVNEPDKWFEDFPPGMMIAYYNFPMFPGEAKGLDLTFDLGVRNPGGGDIKNVLKFSLPLKSEWKLPAGASFGADEVTEQGDD